MYVCMCTAATPTLIEMGSSHTPPSTPINLQAFVPPTALKLQQPQGAAVKGYARARGQAGMAAGETALIIQNKGGL
jgi:hypothetical protein